MTKKILITGGSGFLGNNLYRYFKEKYSVFALVNKKKTKNITKEFIVNCNALNYKDLRNKILQISPDIIINTIGLANVELSEFNIKLANSINIDTALNLTKISKENKIKFIHISTDHLYGNINKKKTEKSKVTLLNNYAKTKYKADIKVLKHMPSSLIIRTNFFGNSSTGKTFVEKIIKSLMQKKKIKLFDDVFFTPVYINELANFINQLILINAKGIYNIATDEVISKYNFGIMVANMFRLDRKYIVKSKLENTENLVTRPKFMTLSNIKLKKKLNLKKISIHSNLKKFHIENPLKSND